MSAQWNCAGYYLLSKQWCTWDGALYIEARDFCRALGRSDAWIFQYLNYCGGDESGSALYMGATFQCCSN
jgi:hypothetical protein